LIIHINIHNERVELEVDNNMAMTSNSDQDCLILMMMVEQSMVYSTRPVEYHMMVHIGHTGDIVGHDVVVGGIDI